MNNKGMENEREKRFRDLLGGYVRRAAPGREFAEGDHLIGDDINAFIEGNLSEKEATPITSHLADCGFCRHRSAELIRLHLEFADSQEESFADDSAPSKVSDVLSDILGRIFGSSEGAVFAHEQKDEQDEDETEEQVED